MEKKGDLVFSTRFGKMCPACNQPILKCECRRDTGQAKGDGVVRVGRETKGRKGKGVTVLTGIPLGLSELIQFCKQLKKKCGSGGTVKNGIIEIQGDHRDFLVEELKKEGWTVRRSGG